METKIKVRQFPYIVDGDSRRVKETEEDLNHFLRGIQFRDVGYSGVSQGNNLRRQYITGMVLVQYEAELPKPKDVIQMKQFILGISETLKEPTHRTLNDFLASADVVDVKYTAVNGINKRNLEFNTGLVLVVYKPSQEIIF